MNGAPGECPFLAAFGVEDGEPDVLPIYWFAGLTMVEALP